MATLLLARACVNGDLFAVVSAHGLVLDWFDNLDQALAALDSWPSAAFVSLDGTLVAKKGA